MLDCSGPALGSATNHSIANAGAHNLLRGGWLTMSCEEELPTIVSVLGVAT